jgi:tRNA (guanine37-N1)-methyltransferase
VALLCGRYEGFDERVHEHLADDEVSIGRYVLAGGELPAMVVADVLMRKLPGRLGHERRAVEESFSRCSRGCPSTRTTRARRLPGLGGSGGPALRRPREVREWRAEQSRAAAEQFEATPSSYHSATARRRTGPAVFSRQEPMSTSSTASSVAS